MRHANSGVSHFIKNVFSRCTHDRTVVSRLFVNFPATRWPSARAGHAGDQPVGNFVWTLWQLSSNYHPIRTSFPARTLFRQSKLTSWLTILLILQAGDIEINPGPRRPKFPRQICQKAAKWGQKCLQCKLCHAWYHADCIGMPDSLYEYHVAHLSLSWVCREGCGMPQFWNMSSSLFTSSRTPNTLNYSLNQTMSSIDPTSPDVQSAPQTDQLPSATSTPIAPRLHMVEPTPSPVEGHTRQPGHLPGRMKLASLWQTAKE